MSNYLFHFPGVCGPCRITHFAIFLEGHVVVWRRIIWNKRMVDYTEHIDNDILIENILQKLTWPYLNKEILTVIKWQCKYDKLKCKYKRIRHSRYIDILFCSLLILLHTTRNQTQSNKQKTLNNMTFENRRNCLGQATFRETSKSIIYTRRIAASM